MALTSDAAALPAEILADILEYLPVDELWTAARVSRQFYAAAWRAGLSIHRDIRWKSYAGYAGDLAVFKDVLEQAQRKDVLRISLTVTRFPLPSFQQPDAYFQLAADEIFSVIPAALPFLVYLSIEIHDQFRPQIDRALRHSAPRLRTLEMRRVSPEMSCNLPIPCDLFAGSAPLLRTLALCTVTLPSATVPAFRAVTQADLTYKNTFPRIKWRDQLPNLKDLHLQYASSSNEHAALLDCSDLAGVPLRSLVIEDEIDSRTPLLDALTRSVDLSAIPVVYAVARQTIKWDEKQWTDNKASLSIRLTYTPESPIEEACLLVNVSPEHRRWRRLHLLNGWDIRMPVPLRGLPNLDAQLTYVRTDALVVRGLLELQLSLSALRNLQIDLRGHESEHEMLHPPDYDATLDVQSFTPTAPRVWTPCPALAGLTLFALHKPVTADSRRIACLAHALGQLGRRVPLALVGVEFAEPVADALLAQTMGTIRRHAFADRAYNDEGRWDFELFNRDL